MPDTEAAPLVETPTAELDSLALVTEVVAKRQEEAHDLRIQISTLRHTIQQERIRWEEQRRQEEQGLRNKSLELERQVAEKMGEADQLVRAQADTYVSAENERRAAVTERSAAQTERQQLGDLNRERVEVERFRTEVNRRHQDAQTKFSEAQSMLNAANQRGEQSSKALAEVERRSAELNALQVRLQEQEQELALQAKHLNIVQDAIGQVIEKLPMPEVTPITPLLAAPDQTPVTAMETMPSAILPPLPTEMTGDVEIASMDTSRTSLPEAPLGVASLLPQQPYVHPSQRRMLDGGKPINDQ